MPFKPLRLKRFKKILLWFILSLLFLVMATWIFIQTPFGQNWIARQVTKKLSRDLQTKVSIDKINLSLFNKMHLEGVLVRDREQDTLLYAGDVQVRITDWFFFRKQSVLKYVGLENAIIKFQRTDSVWRQQFILDYFNSPSTGASKKKNAGISLDLKKVSLKNVAFVKKDGWMGQTLIVQVGKMDMDANAISFKDNTYDIKSLIITDPRISIEEYERKKPRVLLASQTGETNAIDSLLKWNRAGMLVRLGHLEIENGLFRTNRHSDKPMLSSFDGNHIEFTGIHGQLDALLFQGDTIYSKLNLVAKERSGLEIKKLQADMKWAPDRMVFSNLLINTNRSTIRNYFEMSYTDLKDMSAFIHKVKLSADFNDAEIDSDDIAFFAPRLKAWKKKIQLQGRVRGTLDDITGRDMVVTAGNGTLLNGDIHLTGLPYIEQTFIDFKANDFKTTWSDAVTIVPSLRNMRQPDLQKLQFVDFQGNFTGFIRDFVTFGTIRTNLGTVKTDINMKLPVGQEPVYSGTLATDDFDLGSFLNDRQIGHIAMTGTIKGKGFNETTRNTLLDGKIAFVDYNKYRYQDIQVNGKLDKKLFDGLASINDPNARLTLNGVIDFNNRAPSFDFFADVESANLKNLGLSNDSLDFSGKFNLDFTGNNIDNFTGIARITEAAFNKNGKRLPLDSVTLASSYENNLKTLRLTSNEIDATFTGNYNINDLPGAFQLFLNKYYPSYIDPPKRYPSKENFHFDISTQYIDEYLGLVDSSLSGFNYSHIYGDINLDSNSLDLHGTIPQFQYKQYHFNDVTLQANGNLRELTFSGEAKNVKVKDSLDISLATFKVVARNDSSQVSINAGGNQTVDKASLNAMVITYPDGVKIDFDPSTFTINGKTWAIEPNGELEFRKTIPANAQLVLKEGEQKIVLKTQSSTKGRWNDLKVELTKLNMGDLSPFFLPKNRLEGLISGNILVEDPTHNLVISSNDIRTEFLRLDNDSLGEVRASLSYDNKLKELKVNGNTANQENYLGFDAHIFMGDALKQKNNIIALKPKNFQLSVLQRFLSNLFTEMRGYITGDINITGPLDKLNVTGKGRLKDAGLRVNFTQCFYNINDTEVELKQNEIVLDGIVLMDPVTRNPVYVNGSIQHESFQDMFYDLYISTRKPNTRDDTNNRPVLMLNTSYKDNKQFYGNVKATGSLSLAGPQSDMFMKIDAIASTIDTSRITIPGSSTRESGIADFLVERKFGQEMNVGIERNNVSNIVYDVDVTANPMVEVRVVLDDLTGDEIKGKGSGSLNIHSGSAEPLSIRGRYDIEEGDYLFTFQSFFKKPFVLRKGVDNYIEWNGDPNSARIHFDAVYTANRISFGSLQSLTVESDLSNARSDVYVVASLTGDLFKPTISFSLDFPTSSPAVSDPELALIMQKIQANTNELNKQVTYLIVFNSFAPSELETNPADNGIKFNTISGIFLNVINDQINKIFGNLLKNDKYRINLNTSIYNRYIIDPGSPNKLGLSSNVNFSIGRSFFNNRFIITTGVGLDAPLQATSNIQQTIQLLPDVTLEWLINESGTIRATFFYRENSDYLSISTSGGPGRAQRYGGSVTYRKDVDKLWDIFKGKKKRKKPVPELNTGN